MNNTITGFSIEINELSDFTITQIQNNISVLAQEIEKPGLETPLINLTTELARYAITNNFLYIQENYIDLINEDQETMGLAKKARKLAKEKSKIPGEKSIEIADQLREISLQKQLFVSIKIYMKEHHIFIVISHFGKIGSLEHNYINKTMQKVEEALMHREVHKVNRREALSKKINTGLELALLSMHGMGIPTKNFEVATTSDRTYYKVNIPGTLLLEQTTNMEENPDKTELQTDLYSMFTSLQYSLIEFDRSANIVSIFGSILEILHINEDDLHILKEMIPTRFFEDIFWGPFSVKNMKIFENYRLRIESFDKEFRCLFNISGTVSGGRIKTLWQAVNISTKGAGLSEGGAFDNVHIMNMVRPYIPEMILEKAKDCVRKGLSDLPNERKDVTIFFADLISFTQKSETLPHEEVISLLNLTMSTIVQSIERYKGSIDKFIGDGIMCIFDEPLNAVIAATEIQNNLFNLNQFREIGGQAPLELRIGINSGPVILGSVGTRNRMDWTALGDVVNTASRIEKHSMKYSVLLGDKTYQKVKDSVRIAELIKRNFKGKANIHTLFFIESVTFEHDGKMLTMHVPTDQSVEV